MGKPKNRKIKCLLNNFFNNANINGCETTRFYRTVDCRDLDGAQVAGLPPWLGLVLCQTEKISEMFGKV